MSNYKGINLVCRIIRGLIWCVAGDEGEADDALPNGRFRKIAEVQQNSKLTKLFNRKNQDVLSET